MQEEQPLSALLAVSQHLEAGRYKEFWQGVDACGDILASGALMSQPIESSRIDHACRVHAGDLNGSSAVQPPTCHPGRGPARPTCVRRPAIDMKGSDALITCADRLWSP